MDDKQINERIKRLEGAIQNNNPPSIEPSFTLLSLEQENKIDEHILSMRIKRLEIRLTNFIFN